MTTHNRQIAETILRQLGGNKFTVMTGAKDFLIVENGLRFKIGRNSKSINSVTITLNGNDLYDMTFQRKRFSNKTLEVKTTTVIEYKDIYFDQLQEFFTDATGLYTRLF